MPVVESRIEGAKQFLQLAELLTLPPAVKKRFLARMGRMAVVQAKRNISRQQTVQGTPFTPRSSKSKLTGKMLVRLMRWSKVTTSGDAATVRFLRNVGYVAGKHQHGSDELYKHSQDERLFRRSDWFKLCTEYQALHLIKRGFKKSKQEIMATVTVGDAVNYLTAGPQSWIIRVPARPFLGANDQQKQIWGDALMRDIRERFRAKNYGNLLS